MKRPIRLILIVAFILVAVAVVGLAYYASRQPVSDVKLRAVNPGMTDEAVRELLGSPTQIDFYSNDVALGVTGTNWASQWTYERSLPWSTAWVYVTFTNGAI